MIIHNLMWLYNQSHIELCMASLAPFHDTFKLRNVLAFYRHMSSLLSKSLETLKVDPTACP